MLDLKSALAFSVILFPAILLAGKPSEIPTAETVLTQTLHAEATNHTTTSDRRSDLVFLRETTADFPELWWQSGYVQFDGQWQPWEDSVHPESPVEQEYRHLRDNATAAAKDQLQLAEWCSQRGLTEQARAHMVRALYSGQIADPAPILTRLGYRRIGSRWFSANEIQQYQQELIAISRESRRLEPRLKHLIPRLEGLPKQRELAIQDLHSLVNANSLPALESVLGSHSEPTSTALVTALSDIHSFRASQVLARLAILSNWDSVRTSATDALCERPLEHFVPMTLEYLQTPFEYQTQITVVPGRRNQWQVWRFLYTRETRKTIEVASYQVMDTRIIAVNRGTALEPQYTLINRDRRATYSQLEATARQTMDTLYQHQVTADQLNDVALHLNQRTGMLLSKVTQQPPSSDPATWWNWWDQNIMDLMPTSTKPVVIVSETKQLFGPPPTSCLAAGAPVWTSRGFVPIEAIRPGDRVLAKNIDTGELAYKPVLETTRRQGAKLRKISMGMESVEASPGHHFWISGRGWMRTIQLHREMTAHTVTGRSAITVDDTGLSADVYNLVVADFHTYFIGKSMILTHDVIPPAPTDRTVPGLLPNVF